MGICESICANFNNNKKSSFASVSQIKEDPIECIICLEKLNTSRHSNLACPRNKCIISCHKSCIHLWFLQKKKCPICHEIWEKEPVFSKEN